MYMFHVLIFAYLMEDIELKKLVIFRQIIIGNQLSMSENDATFNDIITNSTEMYEDEGEEEIGTENEVKEIEAAEKVINAMRNYRNYGMMKLKRQADAIRVLPEEDKKLLIAPCTEHVRRARECIEQNQKLLEMIVHCGANVFGGAVRKAFEINQLHPTTEHYMSKAKSTLKQIVRDWSAEGANERGTCYQLAFEEMQRLYPVPASRSTIKVLVTGAGLARLAWELRQIGFCVVGNEFSYFMLLTSNFVLNACQQKDEFTIYPYVLDFSNSWSYEDQLKPVTFPDVDPTGVFSEECLTNFSMCAGDFLQVYADSRDEFQAIVSVFFLDTGANPLEYIRLMHRLLKPGGHWINFGPLTYHHEDSSDTLSLELPFLTILRLVEQCGFSLDTVKTKGELPPSRYTWNPDSMLQYSYHCGYFVASKKA